jgi:hypothetical protein
VKRRRRRNATQLVAARTLIDIRQKKRTFLKEVGAILSEALGFDVKVSLSKPDPHANLSPEQRRYARMSRADARAQVRDAFAPLDGRKS